MKVVWTVLLAVALSCCKPPSDQTDLNSVKEVSTSNFELQANPAVFQVHKESRVEIRAGSGRLIGEFTRIGGRLTALENRVIGKGTHFFLDPLSFGSPNATLTTSVHSLLYWMPIKLNSASNLPTWNASN